MNLSRGYFRKGEIEMGSVKKRTDSLFCGKATAVATVHRTVAKSRLLHFEIMEDGFVVVVPLAQHKVDTSF